MPVAQPKPKSKSKGRAGAKTAHDAAAQQQFEKEHPRAAKGRVGGGAWIEKGQGMQGTPDTRVKQLQNRLASLGYNVVPDGRFGPVTEQAIRALQRRNGLTVDGKVGEATTAVLKSGHPVGAQAAAAGHAAAGAPSAPAAPSATASASPGAYGAKYEGDSAAAKQARGDQNEALAGQRDLGTKTKAQKHAASQAKKARRSGSGSGVTTTDSGVVSDGGSLESGDPNAGTGSSSSRSTRSRSHATDTIALGLGMDRARGDNRVKQLQQMLDDIGGNLGAGGVDGKFGPDTKKALLRFQRRYGLKADGILGKKTRMALNTVQKLMNARDRVRPGSSLSEHLTNDRAVVMAALREADTKHDYPDAGASSKGEGMKRCPSCGWRNAKGTTKCKKCSANLAKKGDAKLSEADGPKIKLGNKPGKSNWLEKAGGLPSYIKRIAEHVKGKNPGWADGRCIAVAVNAAKKMCSSGDTNLPGAQQVNAASKAEACAAVASWEAKKGKSLSEAELYEIATFAHRPVLAEGFTLRELAEAAEALEEADITFDPRKHPRGRGGEFRRTLGKLRKAGDTLKMPDGTSVTRGQRYHNLAVPGASGSGSGTAYVVKGRDGKAQRVFSSDQAANLALGMSASSTHPESLGGTTAHPSITAFEQSPGELAKARAAQDAADKARFEKDRAESDAHLARLEAARRPDGTIRFRNGEGRTGTMYPGPSLDPYRGGGTPVVVSWDDLPNVEGGRGVTPLYAHIEPITGRPAPASPGTDRALAARVRSGSARPGETRDAHAAATAAFSGQRAEPGPEREAAYRRHAAAARAEGDMESARAYDDLARMERPAPASPGTGTPGTPGIKPYPGMGKFVVVQQHGDGSASTVDGANTPEAARRKARLYPGTTSVHPNEPGSPPAPGTVYRYGKRATASRTAPPASPGVPPDETPIHGKPTPKKQSATLSRLRREHGSPSQRQQLPDGTRKLTWPSGMVKHVAVDGTVRDVPAPASPGARPDKYAKVRGQFNADRIYDKKMQLEVAKAQGYDEAEFKAAEDYILGSIENGRDDGEMDTFQQFADAVMSGLENWHDDPSRAAPASPGVPNPTIAPEHRTVLANAIEGYAEGAGEILRDDWDPADGEPPETFPWEEDLLAAADRVRAGSIEGIDQPTLDAILADVTDDSGVLPGQEPLLPPAAVAELRRAAGVKPTHGRYAYTLGKGDRFTLPGESRVRTVTGVTGKGVNARVTDDTGTTHDPGIVTEKPAPASPGVPSDRPKFVQSHIVDGDPLRVTVQGGVHTATWKGQTATGRTKKQAITAIMRLASRPPATPATPRTPPANPGLRSPARVRELEALPVIGSARLKGPLKLTATGGRLAAGTRVDVVREKDGMTIFRHGGTVHSLPTRYFEPPHTPTEATPEQRRATAARARQAERLSPGADPTKLKHRDRVAMGPSRQGAGMFSPGLPPSTTDPAAWDAYIGAAPNFADAQDRLEAAVRAGVQPRGMLDAQDSRTSIPKVHSSYDTAYPAAQAYANQLGREVGLRKSREFGKDVYTIAVLPDAAHRFGEDLKPQVVPPTRARPTQDQRNAAAAAAHPEGTSVTTMVHGIGGRSAKVTGTVVGHKRGMVMVRTDSHGTLAVPLDKIEGRSPPASPGITSTSQFLSSLTPEQRAASERLATHGVRDSNGLTFAQRQAQIGSPDANEAEALALLDTDPAAAREKFWDAWEGLPVGPSPRKDRLEAAAKAAQRGDAEAARRALRLMEGSGPKA